MHSAKLNQGWIKVRLSCLHSLRLTQMTFLPCKRGLTSSASSMMSGENPTTTVALLCPFCPQVKMSNQIVYARTCARLTDWASSVVPVTGLIDVPGRNVRWDRYGNDFDSDATGDFLRMQHSGRAGATGCSVVVRFVTASLHAKHGTNCACAVISSLHTFSGWCILVEEWAILATHSFSNWWGGLLSVELDGRRVIVVPVDAWEKKGKEGN